MTNTFNVYDNIRTPKIQNTTTINQWFDLIKKSDYSSLIESARPFGKKHPIYEANKAIVPAITYNFTFHTNKENVNISGATGLLYIDVDDINFDITSLDTNKVFAYYKSYGGAGYSILVQVSGLTLDNYEATYESISTDLGLAKVYDKGAKKATQFNVLSYDPNIYVNYDSFVFDFVLSPVVIEKKKKTYTTGLSTKNDNSGNILRFDNLNEVRSLIDEDKECIYNWDGWEYINCWLPFKQVKAGNRNNSLLSYCNNLVWLNPHLTTFGAESILNRVNLRICAEPVDSKQIKRIVASIFKYKREGKLKPIINRKTRKIVFASGCGLTKEQKFRLCGQLMNEHKTDLSLQKMNDAIEDWDFEKNGKITIRAVVKVAKMGNNTVQKYWNEFKDYIQSLNDTFYLSQNLTSVDESVLSLAVGQVKPEPEYRDLVIANTERYKRGTALISLFDRFQMETQLTYLINTGFTGEIEIVADDTVFVFDISTEVEFVGFGELVKVA